MAKESVLFTREDCAQSGSYANDVLKEMFYDLNFRDVTLTADDGEEISAHKIVLSSGSNLLKTILGRQGKSSPIIICRGVRFNELKSMIEFIYLGQTSVENLNVKNFLAVADEYGVQGLTPVSTKIEKSPTTPTQVTEQEQIFVSKRSPSENLEDSLIKPNLPIFDSAFLNVSPIKPPEEDIAEREEVPTDPPLVSVKTEFLEVLLTEERSRLTQEIEEENSLKIEAIETVNEAKSPSSPIEVGGKRSNSGTKRTSLKAKAEAVETVDAAKSPKSTIEVLKNKIGGKRSNTSTKRTSPKAAKISKSDSELSEPSEKNKKQIKTKEENLPKQSPNNKGKKSSPSGGSLKMEEPSSDGRSDNHDEEAASPQKKKVDTSKVEKIKQVIKESPSNKKDNKSPTAERKGQTKTKKANETANLIKIEKHTNSPKGKVSHENNESEENDVIVKQESFYEVTIKEENFYGHMNDTFPDQQLSKLGKFEQLPDGQYKCDSCDYKSDKKKHAFVHKMSQHIKLKLECDVCESTFTDPRSLKMHKGSVHEDVRYECDMCERTTNTAYHLACHKKKRHSS